jgi:hypothetical protein
MITERDLEPRKVLINGQRVRLAGDHLPDVEVASNVRMLMRDQLDHEAVCVTARDRIMWLSQENERLRTELQARRSSSRATVGEVDKTIAAAKKIDAAIRSMAGKRLPIRFPDDETAMAITAIVENAGKVAKAILTEHSPPAKSAT